MDPDYALIWPRPLFEWEAKSVLRLPDKEIGDAVALLLREAYKDPDVSERFIEDTEEASGPWDAGPEARAWVTNLLKNDARLRAYAPPKYWAERNNLLGKESQPSGEVFSSVVIREINALQENGYFPRLLPRDCVDDETDYGAVTREIRDATFLSSVSWPIQEPEASWQEDDVLFTLIEFFHDHAQRPRTFWIHTHADCGPHFENHRRLPGSAVYRWRMNRVLTRFNKPLRLASKGAERGRLVRHFGSGLDTLAEAQVTDGDDAPTATAEAVRMYRERGASLPQERSALILLAGELEHRRQAIKATVMKKDEAALFQFANDYGVRHQRDGQHGDYGREYLDWVFWNFLATVDLMTRLEQRRG